MLSRILVMVTFAVLTSAPNLMACPFCNAVSQTLRQEMAAMDSVVIAVALQGDATRNKETGEVAMKVIHVLKGPDYVSKDQKVNAVYYGEVKAGRTFMLSGVDPPQMQWSCLPLSDRAKDYVLKLTSLPDDDVDRLRFYQGFLQDSESMLARDAYDEFAIAPYEAVQKLGPEMDHDQLVKWISDPEMSTDRKRLYLTMLGVCGKKSDLPMLEEMLRSTQKSTRGGLDALVACYLTLSGESGLKLIDELFLANKKAPYAETYAAIMAIRFHGTEGDVIPRSALVESLHYVLERPDLADLVIPDLARWKDWSQIGRLVDLFASADAENNWVRVPVVNYLRACPLPKAKEALKKLEEIDPDSVRRANTFFTIPVPAKEADGNTSALPSDESEDDVAVIAPADDGQADNAKAVFPSPAKTAGNSMNPWRLVCVLGLGLATVAIAQVLILTGGTYGIEGAPSSV